jgi:hypothetical protein
VSFSITREILGQAVELGIEGGQELAREAVVGGRPVEDEAGDGAPVLAQEHGLVLSVHQLMAP